MTKYIFFAGGMEEGNRAMKLRSTAVMSASALTWRSSCPVLSVRIARSSFRTGFTQFQRSPSWVRRRPSSPKLRSLTRLESPSTRSWPKDLERWHWTTENTFRSRNAMSAGGCTLSARMPPRLFTSGKQCATIEYFRDTVFNYPTLAEAYKLAALDGLNKL